MSERPSETIKTNCLKLRETSNNNCKDKRFQRYGKLPVHHCGRVCRPSELVFLNSEWTPYLFSSAATLFSALHFPAQAPSVEYHSRSAESCTFPLRAL